MRKTVSCAVALLSISAATPSFAEITRVQIETREPVTRNFGAVGAYEIVRGHVFGELDPSDPKNVIITDLALAPRNARGRVEYSATFAITKPVDMSKASGFLIYDVPNRGFTLPLTGDPRAMSIW
ncbi:hypothetical protein [Brevundimonas goettingensis]|uniref:Uncharacterized protein n=1 Tax=Brevundimonas goettingensis TaxID=2774190 RepID=A0A975GV54_9CAUL|nr:hypothetical protein [Brevundimonas goettingensis]QTC90218.1 hypothetical protein IFJ75_13115 [Brevundimonas goettingensis]